MLGIEPPGWMEGTTSRPRSTASEPPEKREFHYGGMYNRFFIRTDDYVLIGDNQGNERTLYDLRQDPHEFFDIEPRTRRSPRSSTSRCWSGRRAAAVLRVGDRGDAGERRRAASRRTRQPARSPARGGTTAARRAAITMLISLTAATGAAGASCSAASTIRYAPKVAAAV